MSTSEMLELLSAVPTWVWVIGGIVAFFFFFGERILWKYEVKFPMTTETGRGKIKLLYGKKKGARIRCSFELNERHRGKKIDIYLQNKRIHSIPADQTKAAKYFKSEKISLEKPDEGADIEVYADRDKLFSGVLVLD